MRVTIILAAVMAGLIAGTAFGWETARPARAAVPPPKPAPTCDAQLDKCLAVAVECADLLNHCGAAALDLAERLAACEAEP